MASTIIPMLIGSLPGHHPTAPSLSSAVAATPTADGVDRISALPEELLREIISRLPVRDAARTAAIVSRWRGLWRSTRLVLRDDDLLPASDDNSESARAAASATTGRVLAHHPGPFGVVHLTCSAFTSRELPKTRLPADILHCASLRRLFLGTWRFPDTAGAHRGPDVFPELKELGMCSTTMGDHDLDHMLACSPKLETLSLIFTIIRPGGVRICSQRLQCMLFLTSTAEELAVLDAPCLQRLIMRESKNYGSDGMLVVKIDRAPELRVLGYLEPAAHRLQIGNVVISAETKESPSSILPSVKILGLKVNFSVFEEVNLIPNFLRCFPNVETLHIQSAFAAGEATGSHHAKFWPEVRHIVSSGISRKLSSMNSEGAKASLNSSSSSPSVRRRWTLCYFCGTK
ncbi:hypothetical protein U9M48_018563 [Paspalum notatum var. saurae]|uniref:F-box domain-containing protein n=1 Tax=Paspalum notatum var. saurae TaxID=547442 RepID=A0AAQ3WPW7_PASNO